MRFEELRIDLVDMIGVRLPSPDWQDLPGSPLQARTVLTDPVGTFYVRVKPRENDEAVS